ncbi:hypothetical protein DPEC_G00111600 [Dallia pectoralis]|uniref:Uncharacterized protein n=1 Tax=Dallia pectoralis TaxID=75939 RepID=A0ACC2GTS4_DALPE|nr:hypothetical protein DPEC_G00111600 [Dallia pectoralis]
MGTDGLVVVAQQADLNGTRGETVVVAQQADLNETRDEQAAQLIGASGKDGQQVENVVNGSELGSVVVERKHDSSGGVVNNLAVEEVASTSGVLREKGQEGMVPQTVEEVPCDSSESAAQSWQCREKPVSIAP